MKQFIAFVKKEFFHIFRDRRTMLILLGMPVVQIILFGFAITTEVKNVRVGVLDPSNDIVTRKIIDRLDASEYFSVKCLLHSPQEMERVFQENEIDMALVFSEQFADRLYTGDARVQLVSDATDPNMATTQAGYATGVIAAVRQEMLPPGMLVPSVVPNVKLLYNPQMKSAYNFVPGVMGLILMLICAMMTSISIVREKETGTMEILLVSPVKPLFIILAKAVPYFVLSFVNLTTILLLAVYVLDVPVAGSLFWLIMVSLLFIFVSLSLGLLISTVTRTQVAAMLASGLVLMMPTMLLSGMIFPIESMPLVLQLISDILPARWYIQAVRKLMIEGVDISFVWSEVSILALMAVLLITISFKKFKNRLWTSGEYLLDDIPVRTMSKPQRAVLRNRKIGFVFQSYNLLPKTTAVENVELPLMYNSAVSASERRRRAIESLQAVGLGDRLEHKSNQMSGGQMQRVAIARALVNNPAVILADEATGNLDSRTSFEILVLFQKLHAEGRTIIFVTHNPELSQYSSRNIRLRDGQVIEDTTNPKILSAAEALAALPKNDED